MEKIFIEVLNLGISASYLILAVLLARFLLKKAPKNCLCVLWILVGVRLLCPFSIESMFSLIPSVTVVEESIMYEESPAIHSGITNIDTPVNQFLGENYAAERSWSVNPMQIVVFLGARIWLAGIAGLLLFFLFSFWRLKRKVRTSVPDTADGIKIYRCEGIDMPFLAGVFRPRIYIPFDMQGEMLTYVTAHEMAHKKRKDFLMKPIGYLILVVYWFQPLVWISYLLFCRDLELACDEKVIKELGGECKKGYSMALLSCSSGKKGVFACPVAFGKTGVRQRIKNVLNYRKPAVLLIVAAVFAGIIIVLCFMTQKQPGGGPQSGAVNESTEQQESEMKNLDTGNEKDTEIFPQAADNLDTESADSENMSGTGEQYRRNVETWANAFCSRDGKAIVSMMSQEAVKEMEDREMLDQGENGVSFGFSSPWPVNETGCQIIALDDSSAEILYYAWVSDPHLTVWRETLNYKTENGKWTVTFWDMEILDHIVTTEEFYRAYPDGIIEGTMMDYQNNGLGEALNQNAKAQKETYSRLFDPGTAACDLLNLLNNPNKVEVSVRIDKQTNNVDVQIYFVEDGNTVTIRMGQPYGEDGIWVPGRKPDIF